MRGVLTTVLAGLALTFSAPGLSAQSPHDLFQQALVKEQVEGDLRGAIDLYERIVDEHADRRSLAVRALLQMGDCYEKLGQEEAREVYRRVIVGFPEHREAVAVARERLARIRQAAARFNPKPSFEKVEIPSRPSNGVLSPDGRWLAYESGRRLWVVPLQGKAGAGIAGEPVALTDSMGVWNLGNTLAWSSDSRWIAFNAWPRIPTKSGSPESNIYLVSVDGSTLREVPGAPDRHHAAFNYRLALWPGGDSIAAVRYTDSGPEGIEYPPSWDNSLWIVRLPVDGGPSSRLTRSWTREPAISPDGRHLAFIRWVSPPNPENLKQLWVVPLEEGEPTLLLDSVRAAGPVWSPDGELIAVAIEDEESNESTEIWVVPSGVGRSDVDEPVRLELPSSMAPLLPGWTALGELGVFLISERRSALFTVSADGGEAAQITPFVFAAWHPRFAPDGEAVLFRHFEEGPVHALATVPADGGEPSTLPIPSGSESDPDVVPYLRGMDVSPDGRAIAFSGSEAGVRPREADIWTTPIRGGSPTRLTGGGADLYPSWSPDGDSVAFLRVRSLERREGGNSIATNIHMVPAAGGETRQLTSDADSVIQGQIAFSPDGQSVAFFTSRSPGTPGAAEGAIEIIPTTGGEPRVLVTLERVSWYGELAWSPDGEEIAFTGPDGIAVVDVEKGVVTDLETGFLSAPVDDLHIDWSPDGRKLVFSATRGGDPELWLMSDFLPGKERR